MPTASGTVFRYGSAERIVCASVKAIATDGMITQTITNKDGDFTFINLNPDNYSFIAMQEDSFPNLPVVMNIIKDTSEIQIKLQRLAGDVDISAGQKFFNWLLGILGGLVIVYVILHTIFPLRPVASPLSFTIWDKDPWRLLEVIMWGLGGILINKIITSGWYIRSQRFYKEGIVMHVAHLVSTPLLVLVAVLLLSLATFKISLTGGSEVTLDLSNPNIMAAVAFLLGSSPWPLWNFIEKTARNVTGQAEK